jgi:hypothetical protein
MPSGADTAGDEIDEKANLRPYFVGVFFILR